jgi:N,N'-diacetyllegionaminate synthase
MGGLGKRVIISTGMSNLADIEAAINVLENSGTPRAMQTVLHCTTEYPAPICEVNLLAMKSIQSAFRVNVGYSDHTIGIEVAIAAVALGAKIIEKHFTLDRGLPGPDHKASLEPKELVSMISSIRNIEMAMGDGIKRVTDSEIKNAKVARKSIVAKRAIKSGEIFTNENLSIKRPGTGLSPMLWDHYLGLKARRDYLIDELIDD